MKIKRYENNKFKYTLNENDLNNLLYEIDYNKNNEIIKLSNDYLIIFDNIENLNNYLLININENEKFLILENLFKNEFFYLNNDYELRYYNKYLNENNLKINNINYLDLLKDLNKILENEINLNYDIRKKYYYFL